MSEKRRYLRGWRGGERIAAEHSESASQNSFLIPISQKVAEPRVSSGAEVITFETAIFGRKTAGFERSAEQAEKFGRNSERLFRRAPA